MARYRKLTNRLIQELTDLRDSRKSIDEFNFNFLGNFGEHCQLMHMNLQKNQVSKELVKVAYRQYFVFLVSCWETFFRDVFVYIYSRDSKSLEILLEKMNITETSPMLQNVALPELLGKSFNFQNINDFESAYYSLWGEDFLEYLCKTETCCCGLNGKVTKGFSITSLFPEWRKIINESFEIRHKVIHDSNYRPELDVDRIQQSEALFLMLPQVVTYFIAKRFELKSMALSNGEYTVPYLFSVHDILANDWEAVE